MSVYEGGHCWQCRSSTWQQRGAAANSVPCCRSTVHKGWPFSHSTEDSVFLADAVEFTFMCFHVFHVEYPFQLRNAYLFLEHILGIKPSARSTTVSNLILSLSKVSQNWSPAVEAHECELDCISKGHRIRQWNDWMVRMWMIVMTVFERVHCMSTCVDCCGAI